LFFFSNPTPNLIGFFSKKNLGGLDGISFKHKKNQIKEKKAHMTKKNASIQIQ
jgi:hypothetical protein